LSKTKNHIRKEYSFIYLFFVDSILLKQLKTACIALLKQYHTRKSVLWPYISTAGNHSPADIWP